MAESKHFEVVAQFHWTATVLSLVYESFLFNFKSVNFPGQEGNWNPQMGFPFVMLLLRN